MCRAYYLAFARRSKTLAAKSFKIKATHTISTLEQPTSSNIAATLDSVMGSKETRVRRRLSKRRDSHDYRTAPSEQFAFFDTPKRIKKQMEFRTRCANALNLKFASIRDTLFKSKIVRNGRRRRKKCEEH